MEDLFSPFRIKRLELRNRFVRSATHDGTADAQGMDEAPGLMEGR